MTDEIDWEKAVASAGAMQGSNDMDDLTLALYEWMGSIAQCSRPMQVARVERTLRILLSMRETGESHGVNMNDATLITSALRVELGSAPPRLDGDEPKVRMQFEVEETK